MNNSLNQSPINYELSSISNRKVAIVHDWLIGGGAEKVVLQLHELFPDAPIYTSYATKQWKQRLGGNVKTGYLQYWPLSKLRKFLPLLRISWFRNINLSSYDVIISSSGNGEAKFITKRVDAVHICYCHTPTHFYWRHYDAYLKNPGFGIFNKFARLGLKILVNPLRKKDYYAAQKVDNFIANSTHIAADIKTYYDRDSTVVFPPVDIDRFTTDDEVEMTNDKRQMTNKRSGFVTVGRLVPNKRVDLMIAACNQLKVPLTIIGKGPEYKNLKKQAGKTIKFLKNASDEQVEESLRSAEAFIFAGHEDFGIAPVEALAAGTPVIAYNAGGALDYVVEGKTGTFFNEQTIISLAAAINSFEPSKYNSNDIKSFAKKFSKENFNKNFLSAVNRILQ